MTADLQFRGWQRAASEAMLHAVTDEVPECVIRFVGQAREAAANALEAATNPRQIAMTESLLRAADQIELLAQNHPERM